MKLIFTFLAIIIGITSVSGTRINSFDLTDQYQKSRHYHFPKAKVTLIVVADHKGSPDLRRWIGYTYQQFGSAIDIDGVADVSTVPSLLQGVIRNVFREQVDHSVMLDWNGSVVRQFEYVKAKANLYLLDFDGTVIGHISGPPEMDRVDILFRMITVTLEQRRRNE